MTLKVFSLASLAYDGFPVALYEFYVPSAVNVSGRPIQFAVLHVFRGELDFYLQQRIMKYSHFCNVSRHSIVNNKVSAIVYPLEKSGPF